MQIKLNFSKRDVCDLEDCRQNCLMKLQEQQRRKTCFEQRESVPELLAIR